MVIINFDKNVTCQISNEVENQLYTKFVKILPSIPLINWYGTLLVYIIVVGYNLYVL